MNNIISNKIEQLTVTCASYNKLYMGGTNRNFNTRFREHRKILYTQKVNLKRIEKSMSID